jgi:hypothetical protein
MPNWLSPLLIAVVTAVLTTTVASLTVVPRLEARNRRIQAGHQAREGFGIAILTVLVTGSLLSNLTIPQDATAPVRDSLEREGARWRQQLDKATEELADSTAPLSFVFVLRDDCLCEFLRLGGLLTRIRHQVHQLLGDPVGDPSFRIGHREHGHSQLDVLSHNGPEEFPHYVGEEHLVEVTQDVPGQATARGAGAHHVIQLRMPVPNVTYRSREPSAHRSVCQRAAVATDFRDQWGDEYVLGLRTLFGQCGQSSSEPLTGRARRVVEPER